jgi:DNA-directed RNA polymerase subunit RPC12/RpoP
VQGKRALYSVDPEATPMYAAIVACPRCGVERGLVTREAVTLLRPPWIVNPLTRTLYTRCPTCEHRVWLRIRLGPGIPWPR